jgi:hypothetical protein
MQCARRSGRSGRGFRHAHEPRTRPFGRTADHAGPRDYRAGRGGRRDGSSGPSQ